MRARRASGHASDALAAGWSVASARPGAIAGPGALDAAGLDWVAATAPATAASALRAAGRFSLDEGAPRRFDAEDWWWRTRFSASPAPSDEETWLYFDGLATLADVW